MSGPRVLVVGDEPETRRLLQTVLSKEGYAVETAASGAEALELASLSSPNVVVLELVLPDMSGLDLCQALHEWTTVPVIIVSARTDVRTKVEALDRGADHYLTEPFRLNEFLARVRVAVRRGTGAKSAPVLEAEALQLDQVRRHVTLNGREVHLTPTEYEILRYLMGHAGEVITHGTLRGAVWGAAHAGNMAILRVFIAQLRRKIEPDPERPSYIETVPRIGYRFCAEATPAVPSTGGG